MIDDKISCEICNKQFRRITRTHLIKHDLTTIQYKQLYPDSPIICNSLLQETGKYFKESNPMKDLIIAEKVAFTHRGRPKSEEHKRKLSAAQSGEKNHGYGKKRPEHSKLMKEIMPDIMKQLYSDGRSGYNKGKKLNLSDEQRKSMVDRNKGKIKWPNGNPNKGKKLNLSDEQKLNRSLKSSEWLKNNRSKSKGTDIEIKFENWCIDNNIEYEPQYMLTCKNTTWLFDFYIPILNMLVEIDGEFWHSTKKQINRDKLKENNAITSGYNFCRISSLNLDFSIITKTINEIRQHNLFIIEKRLFKHY